MSQAKLPMTVIAGYLGAGKTTLINRLLSEAHGQRVMVLVNDFGAINIDADLLVSAEDDTLLLSNGCVCCTIGGDLFMAIGDALDRVPRPEHLIVEASGVAEPSKIANAALAEPDLSYGGIVTIADALNYRALASDRFVGDQVKTQVRSADLVLVSKENDPALALELGALSGAPVMALQENTPVSELILDLAPEATPNAEHAPHPAYAAWSAVDARRYDRAGLLAKLAKRPDGLYRIKGRLRARDDGLELHVVGGQVNITPCDAPEEGRIVAIGPKAAVDVSQVDIWWG